MPEERPSWREYFMEITKVVASRSTCLRRQVGAIAVIDKRILATGYNGAPSHLKHCQELGCLRQNNNVPSGQRHEICRALHAEQNVIIQAAYHGVSLADAELYCTDSPCVICAKMIINTGIKRIVYLNGYPDELAISMLEEAGLELEPFSRREGNDQ
jgi:dCMP deaminase